jgi:hypothetical protein
MPQKKNNFNKKVKAIIQKELSEEIEEKHAITEYFNVSIKKNIPSGIVLNGQGNFFKILPEIEQSVSGEAGRAYNTRLGNEINLKKLDITMAVNYAFSNTAQTTYEDAKIACRIMILRAKEINDAETLFDNMPTDTLIRFGNQALGTANGVASFGGFELDAFRALNRDTFSVRYDKVVYLDAPVLVPGTSGGQDLSVVPSRSKILRHTLTFGKNGLKLKYSSQSDVNANNFPYFMVVGYSSMSSGTRPADNLVRMTVSAVSSYTDA